MEKKTDEEACVHSSSTHVQARKRPIQDEGRVRKSKKEKGEGKAPDRTESDEEGPVVLSFFGMRGNTGVHTLEQAEAAAELAAATLLEAVRPLRFPPPLPPRPRCSPPLLGTWSWLAEAATARERIRSDAENFMVGPAEGVEGERVLRGRELGGSRKEGKC